MGLRRRLETLRRRATSTASSAPVRAVHSDLAPGTMLFTPDGDLAAPIDVGQACLADPATDLAFGWLICTDGERHPSAGLLHVDDAAWLRSAAWALRKTHVNPNDGLAGRGYRRSDDLLAALDGPIN